VKMKGKYIFFSQKAATGWLFLTITGLSFTAGCAGPRWTGPGDLIKKEMAPEHDTLCLTSRPSSAKVFVNERLAGITPLSVELSFRRIKCYRENLLMDGEEIIKRKRIDYGVLHTPEFYEIKIIIDGYKVYSLKHTGDDRDGRYSADVVLQRE